VAFALLVFIGVRMIIEALKRDESKIDKPDPTKGVTMVMLSVATSIDAFAVGLSLSFLRVSIWWPALGHIRLSKLCHRISSYQDFLTRPTGAIHY
jgi:putative Mn2+ efflux pump MntP